MSQRSHVADVSGGPIKGELGNPLVSLSKGRREPVLCCIDKLKGEGKIESSLIFS